ncbi:MAG: ABC transporter permease [Anaerolineae bacterium]
MTLERLRTRTRITWAIASKDIGETLRNKNALSLIVSVLFVVLLYRFLPQIRSAGEPPVLRIYDAGDSALTVMLENSSALETRADYATDEQMKRALTHDDLPQLGIVIPEDFDRELGAGAAPEITGYVLHWVRDEDARELQQLVEGEIAALLGTAVPVHISDARVYPEPDAGGVSVSAGMATSYAILMVAMLIPPYLILEEKKNRTLDALLVSPATPRQVVAGKAIAGLLYAGLGCAIACAVNGSALVHWPLAIAAGLVGGLFAVGLGLLLGSLLESRQQLMLWAWIVLLPMILPMMLYLMEELIPRFLFRIFTWMPVTVMFSLIRTSFAGDIGLADWAPRLIVLFGYALAILVAVAWVIRRQDR